MTLTRRDFLKTSALFTAWAALSACRPGEQDEDAVLSESKESPTAVPDLTESPPVPPLNDEALLLHTLRRVTFGPTSEMLDQARRVGLEAFLEEHLSPESIPDDETERLVSNFSTLGMTAAERFALGKKGQPVQELIAATLLRQWRSQRQVYETMVDFWSNHFSIFIGKSTCKVLKTDDDQQAIRPNALGKFRELLRASAHSPAMLVYLDQATSNRNAPNENYARELLELHTVGVDGGYTHDDIVELARVLTGWTVIGPRSLLREPGRFFFNRRNHDGEQKTVMGMTISPGGEDEGNAVLDMLAEHPNTARFIGGKFARRFISDVPPASVVDTLAAAFTNSDGDTREMLRVLLNTDEFKASAGKKLKRPLEFFISALRVTGVTLNLRGRSRQIQEHLRLLGQIPFTWSTPDGFPDTADHWSTTSGLLQRWNFSLLLTSGQVRGLEVDLHSLTRDAASAEDVVDVLSIRFLGEALPNVSRSILVDFASDGDLGDNLPSVAGLILGSPHFQVR